MKPMPANQSGMTLVELMISLMMSLFLVGGVILMYISSRSVSVDTEQLSRMQENIRFASDYLVRDVRNAGFRDEISLTIDEELAIRDEFARLSDAGDRLTIRYAGRAHCQEEFDQYQVVENTYSLDPNTGELSCCGRDVFNDPADQCDTNGDGIALVSGLSALSFQMLHGDDTTTNGGIVCKDDPDAPLGSQCFALRIGMEFVGLQALDGSGDTDQQLIELFASFRNISLGHIYDDLR